MKKSYITACLIICLLIIHSPNAHAEVIFKWVDEEGNTQYSNALPPQFSENDPRVEIIDHKNQTENAIQKKRIEQLKDKLRHEKESMLLEKCKQYNISLPNIPSNNKKALTKMNKIIADQVVLLDTYKERYKEYLESYQIRKESFEKQIADNKDKFDAHLWRPSVSLESDVKHKDAIQFFELTILQNELILQWAKLQKQKFES